MSGLYGLGDKVVIFDHLIRTRIDSDAVKELRNLWVNPPTTLKEDLWGRVRFDVWFPYSIFKNKRSQMKGHIAMKSKERPAQVLFPLEGIITQEIVLQDGTSDWDEYGSSFNGMSHKKGYKVAYDLRRKPLLVSEDMIREL